MALAEMLGPGAAEPRVEPEHSVFALHQASRALVEDLRESAGPAGHRRRLFLVVAGSVVDTMGTGMAVEARQQVHECCSLSCGQSQAIL